MRSGKGTGRDRSVVGLIFFYLYGAATAKSSSLLALGLALLILGGGLFWLIYKRNGNGLAHHLVAFFVGSEVYFRMYYTGLPWELAKTVLVIFFVLALIIERRRTIVPFPMIIYLLLLLPGFFVPDWESITQFKRTVMYNFSGQVALIVATFYFYHRVMSWDEFTRMMRWVLYGVALMSSAILVKTPDFAKMQFNLSSSFALSGGFGPNQVSVIFGLGILILALFLLLDRRILGSKLLEVGMLGVLSFQGLITFSRGGVFAAVISLVFGVWALYVFMPRQAHRMIRVSLPKIFLVAILLLGSFQIANTLTKGYLEMRYLNKDKWGDTVKADYTTGRLEILMIDLGTFEKNWITGAGIGGSKVEREAVINTGAAHIEYSRILADNGILGLLALIILFAFPVREFFRRSNPYDRLILTVFISLALLTMSHNAMRLAAQAFFYGMGLILLRMDQERVKR